MDTKYRLYAAKEDKKIPKWVKYSFRDFESPYVLIFTDKNAEGFREIDKEHMRHLTKNEKTWLFLCKNEVIKEYIGKHENDFFGFSEELADRFEKELKIEVEKVNGNAAETENR